MKTNVIETNRMIAEFMGFNIEIVNGEIYLTHDEMVECLCDEELYYYTSWDYLMPVVEKCLEGEAEQNDDMAKAFINAIYEGICTIDIEEAYKSVVKYINWYNSIKK